MQENNLTVCILALNAEKQIENTLKSVQNFAQEIVVGIDSLTTDETSTICQKYTDKIFSIKHQDNFDVTKNEVIAKAQNDWILWLDADEILDNSLQEEIVKILQNPQADIYKIPRKNFIFSKWITHTGWYPDYQIRLFKKESVKFNKQFLHQDPEIKGKVATLENHLIHENYSSISHFIQKLDQYTNTTAYNQKDKKLKKTDFINVPINEFIKRFLALEGFKDGLHGLILSILQAFYEFIVIVKIWETQKCRQETIEPKLIKENLQQGLKDFNWWILENKIQDSQNTLQKISYKIQRKIKS